MPGPRIRRVRVPRHAASQAFAEAKRPVTDQLWALISGALGLGTPQLNGKVERSHRTDKDELYQLLAYKDDVDL